VTDKRLSNKETPEPQEAKTETPVEEPLVDPATEAKLREKFVQEMGVFVLIQWPDPFSVIARVTQSQPSPSNGSLFVALEGILRRIDEAERLNMRGSLKPVTVPVPDLSKLGGPPA
jgi:hypothetical protein